MKISKLVSDSLRIAQALFCLNASIWLLFGLATLVRLASQNPEPSITLTSVAIMMFGNVGALLLSAWLISKQRMGFYLFAISVLLVNIILTFTDQFGIFDLFTVIIDLILLSILLINRKRFLHPVASTA